MALIIETDFGNGFVANYHRISGYVFDVAVNVFTVTVESHANAAARANPSAQHETRKYDVYTGNWDPVQVSITVHAYQSLLAHADFAGATDDDDNTSYTPSSIPAVESGLYYWDNTTNDWELIVQPTPLEDVRQRAYLLVDGVAGQARLRYISSAPGQAETYLRKETQARTWQAGGYVGSPPSFVAAEAAALGEDPIDVAEGIIAQADLWENGKGPEIEATRIAGKAVIRDAVDEAAIETALADTIAALDAL